MPARGLESNDFEFLVDGHAEHSVDDSERIPDAPPAPSQLHNSFHRRCTFRKVLWVVNELEDLLDRPFNGRGGVDLGRDDDSFTDFDQETRGL